MNASVIDGTGAAPFLATVIIEGDRIRALGPDLRPAEGTPVIDASGLTAIPGLIDLHTHVSSSAGPIRGDWQKHLMAYLYSGVTTIVDFGTVPEAFEGMRSILERNRSGMPDVLLAARFAVPLGHGTTLGREGISSEILTPRQAVNALSHALQYRPDLIKVFTDGWRYGTAADMLSMSEGTLATLVASAHREGLRVLTHTVTIDKGKVAARSGVDGIVHALCDAPADDEVVSLLLHGGTTIAPTMAVYENRIDRVDLPFLRKVLEPGLVDSFPTPERQPRVSPEVRHKRELRWRYVLENTRRLHEAGVPIALGTDAGIYGTFHGWASLRELELLVRAGLTPLEAIRAATFHGATALGIAGDRGTIAAGKRADLVLIEGSPDLDIGAVWNIRRVFHRGREVDREALIREIQTPDPLPLPQVPARTGIDDFEAPGSRSGVGSLWFAGYERAQDRTQVLHTRKALAEGGNALLALFRLADRGERFGSLSLPLSRGAMQIVDARAFEGIRFRFRGEGTYRFSIQTQHVRDGDDFHTTFTAGPAWQEFRIAFSDLTTSRAGSGRHWRGDDLLQIGFEVTGEPGRKRWFELDDLRFY